MGKSLWVAAVIAVSCGALCVADTAPAPVTERHSKREITADIVAALPRAGNAVLEVVLVAGTTKSGKPRTDCTLTRGHDARNADDYLHTLTVLHHRGWLTAKQTEIGTIQSTSLAKGQWTITVSYDPSASPLGFTSIDITAFDTLC